MIDGIFDLLTAILVLGIVVAIAFGFIIPLVNDDVMQYDANFEDKAVLNNVVEYDNPDTLENVTYRKYTYPELVLFMYVQDTRMGEPNKIDLGCLRTSKGITDGTLAGFAKNGDYIITIGEGDNKSTAAYSEEKVEFVNTYLTQKAKQSEINKESERLYSIHYQYEIPSEGEEERYMIHTDDTLEDWQQDMKNIKRN